MSRLHAGESDYYIVQTIQPAARAEVRLHDRHAVAGRDTARTVEVQGIESVVMELPHRAEFPDQKIERIAGPLTAAECRAWLKKHAVEPREGART